jgi:arsenite methyltransferase
VSSSEPVRIVLELEHDEHTISGRIAAADAAARDFYGWLELIDRLERATGAAGSGSGPLRSPPHHSPPERSVSMRTEARQLDTIELKERVQRMYEEVALEPEHEFHFETGRPLAERLGYRPDDLDRIPAAASESFAGVGYFLDLAAIAPGETVLDLGSGSGMDSFLAANQAGPGGHVIGVDMTTAQLAKARRLADQGAFNQVEFREGFIETPPVEDGSVDCVISNGVINLSPDKPAVFAAAARALRPGGRLALADIVTAHQLPEGVTCDAALWAACIGGAMQGDAYRQAIAAAGFQVETWRTNTKYRFLSERADNATQKYGVSSISLLVTPH